ncbi:MAG: MFS transporter [Promethearchaeia archaeon]
MPPLLFGIIYLIFAIWNAVNDPLIGYISDLKKPVEGKGKRLPFMKRSIPIGILGFIIIIITCPSCPITFKFSVLLIGLLIFETAATLLYINNGALVRGLTDDPVERSSIAMISSYINIIPSAITGLIPFYFGQYFLQELRALCKFQLCL